MISQEKKIGFFRTSKRDGYGTKDSVKFGYNSHTIQLFLMEFEVRVPSQKERIVQFDNGDRK
jgi:hypothetical protein